MNINLNPEQELDILNTFKDIFLLQWMEDNLKEVDKDEFDLSQLMRHRQQRVEPFSIEIRAFEMSIELEKRSGYKKGRISTSEAFKLSAIKREVTGETLTQYAFLLASGIEGVVAKYIHSQEELETMPLRPRDKAWKLLTYAILHDRPARIVVDPIHGITVVVWANPTEVNISKLHVDDGGWVADDFTQSCILRWAFPS